MPTLIEMLEAGVHFGHKKERSNPRAKDYIFTLKEGIYVIDLEKTQDYLAKALEYLKQQISMGKTILFVGTKRQAKKIIQEVAESVEMPYINQRWLGGTLTNFETIRKSLQTLENLQKQTDGPDYEKLTKKEKKVISDKITKLESTFGGVKKMKNLPDAVFVIDAAKESLAIEESNRVGIPVVAIADTDANPDVINYPIPANDDAPKSIEMIMGLVKTALTEGLGQGTKAEVKEEESKEEVVEAASESVAEEKPAAAKKETKKKADTKKSTKEK